VPHRLEKLKGLLDELKSEIAAAESIDEATRKLLLDLENEIETALEIQNPEHLDQHSILEQLQESAIDFQADHPALSKFVRRMIDGLGQIGI